MLAFENQTFKDIQHGIALLREKKGSEKKTLTFIDKSLNFGHGVVVNLLWERALIYQHMVMSGDKKALPKMEAAILSAGKYVKSNNLKIWESRYYRFLGRLYDYKKEFSKAVVAYKKAIPLARLDPEFTEKKIPRNIELEGFLSFSLIMSGKVKEGYLLSKKTLSRFDNEKLAKELKKKDYATWAIWKSGIIIRTINAFIDKKYNYNKKEMETWISQAEKMINPPKSIKVWVGFDFRKEEIKELKQRLQGN